MDRETYLDKTCGCWIGKIIGGTLGGHDEGVLGFLDYTYYDPVPTDPQPNDDFDWQLIWIHALEQRGLKITARDLAEERLEHWGGLYAEYAYAYCNLRRGLWPPRSGAEANTDPIGMGAAIRSEIWAVLAPGHPRLAAHYARLDAIHDHAEGGPGVEGEIFLAALQSAAFVQRDIPRLIEIGLEHLPAGSALIPMIEDVRRWHGEGLDWRACRTALVERYPALRCADVIPNIGLVVLGLLYGEGDFEKTVLTAVNCGLDTDCTGATVGSVIGIRDGARAIPEHWRRPIKDEYLGSEAELYDIPLRGRVVELAERMWPLAQQTLAQAEEILAPPQKPDPAALRPEIHADDYAIAAGEWKRIAVMAVGRDMMWTNGEVELRVPAGWEVSSAYFERRLRRAFRAIYDYDKRWQFDVRIPAEMLLFGGNDFQVALRWDGQEAVKRFSLLGGLRWAVLGPLLPGSTEKVLDALRQDWKAAARASWPGLQGSCTWNEYPSRVEWDFPPMFVEENCGAVAVAHLYAEESTPVRAHVAFQPTNDVFRIEVNEKVLWHDRPRHRAAAFLHYYLLELRPGWNRLLVSREAKERLLAHTDYGPATVYFGLTDRGGMPLPGMRMAPWPQ